MYECPKCSGKLDVVMNYQIQLDKCLSCGGLWFDQNELFTLLTGNINFIIDGSRDSESKNYDKKAGVCPLCDIELKRIDSETEKDIHIDKCPSCNGVWLDKGELTSLTLQKRKDALLQLLRD